MVKDYIFENNGSPIRIKLYEVENPTAVVLIIHGMQEHSGRYNLVANRLNEAGFNVVTSDLRGHGSNILFAPGLDDGNIFLNIVEDQKAIISKLRELYPNIQLVVLGHSYGSFVTQRLIRDRVLVDKFVLSGSSYMKGMVIGAGRVVAGLTRFFKGRTKEAKLIEKMSIKGYGKKFKNGNWLSRDEAVWTEYNNDPSCANAFPVAFYASMFKELPKNYNHLKNSVGYRPNIYIFSGENDPVGNYSKGVYKLYDVYRAAGFNVQVKVYAGGRHEMLNEINKDEVQKDLIEYINN